MGECGERSVAQHLAVGVETGGGGVWGGECFVGERAGRCAMALGAMGLGAMARACGERRAVACGGGAVHGSVYKASL